MNDPFEFYKSDSLVRLTADEREVIRLLGVISQKTIISPVTTRTNAGSGSTPRNPPTPQHCRELEGVMKGSEMTINTLTGR